MVIPELLLLCLLWAGLTLYVVMGGADFGAGIWEIYLARHPSKSDRALIAHAIGPVWEANHVWLIFVLIAVMNGFPRLFMTISQALWLPLLLALAGIVFRGAAFAFRSHSLGARTHQSIWSAVFATASVAAPFFLGASVGAIASGQLEFDEKGRWAGSVWTDWVSFFSVFLGLYTVGLCAYLAAVYLTREAAVRNEPEIADRWRRRALRVGLAMGAAAVVGLAMVALHAPVLWKGMQERGWVFILASLAGGLATLFCLYRRHFGAARVVAAATVGSVILGWGFAQHPYLMPPVLTLENSRAPATALWFMVGAFAIGFSLLAPSLWWLLSLFKLLEREAKLERDEY